MFDDNRYFDVLVEYAKQSPNDILIRITAANRGPEPATLHLLPTLWFRNTWSWGCKHEGCWPKPRLHQSADGIRHSRSRHARAISLGGLRPTPHGKSPTLLFTENETNHRASFRLRQRCAVRERFVPRLRHPRHATMR